MKAEFTVKKVKPTPTSTTLLDKLVVGQLVKKLPNFRESEVPSPCLQMPVTCAYFESEEPKVSHCHSI
jgi:hypothetical protein